MLSSHDLLTSGAGLALIRRTREIARRGLSLPPVFAVRELNRALDEGRFHPETDDDDLVMMLVWEEELNPGVALPPLTERFAALRSAV